MRVINVSLSELETKVLMIGFEGENQITQVRIDAAEILTDHPNATPTLIAKPLFGFAYPVIVTKEGTEVVWEIDNSVLSFNGDGEIQLTFTEGTVIAKSYVGRIRIKRSLAVNGEKPDPIETWEQAATAKLAEVDAQIGELEDMVEAAEAAKDEAQDIVDDAAADIQAAGAAQVQVVQAKGTEVLNSIPSDYSTLSGDVNGLKSAIKLLSSSFTVNVEHSSSSDMILTNIAAYEPFYVYIEFSNSTSVNKSLSIVYTDDTTENISQKTLYTKAKAIKNIRAYVYNGSGSPIRANLFAFVGAFAESYKLGDYNGKTTKFQIVFLDNKNPTFASNKQSFLMPGTSCYIGYGSQRKTINYSDILTYLSNYATSATGGITISMPSEGCFGYNIATEKFEMKTGTHDMFNTSAEFCPLYYRYYNVCFGKITEKFIFDNLNELLNLGIDEKISNENYSAKGTIMLQNNAVPSFSDDKYTVTFPGTKLYFIGGSGKKTEISYDTIHSQLSSYTSVTSDGLVLSMTGNMCFGYNVSTNQFEMKTGDTNMFDNTPNFCPLYYKYYTYCFGKIADVYLFHNMHSIVNGTGANADAIIKSRMFNSAYHDGATDFETKCKTFSNLLLGDVVNGVDAPINFETFLFFTDPHLIEGNSWKNRCYEFIAQIQKYYNSTPTTFCLCGGDWLGAGDLPDEACYKLGYIDGFMHSMFDNCYLMVGNHDTNYQGKKDASSEDWTTKLSVQSRKDLWYRKENPYFKIDGAQTVFYCFDTDTENVGMDIYNNYGWTQAQWFANALLTETHEHIAVAMHILYWNYDSNDLTSGLQPLSYNVLKISQAYNSRTSILVNGTSYNFASASGKVEFCIAGHVHNDYNGMTYGIPWVMTTNVRHNENLGASFDLCFADYDNELLKLIRIGDGSNRTISLTTGQIVT